MAGRTSTEAVQAFADPLRRALGCFVRGRVTHDVTGPGSIGVLAFNRGTDVELPGPNRLTLSMSMRYEVIRTDVPDQGPWKVRTWGWIYTIGRDGFELSAFHWHPLDNLDPRPPHVHHRGSKAHIPTGRVTLEDVLAYAVDLGAEPSDADRWSQCYAANLEAFRRGATWGVAPTLDPDQLSNAASRMTARPRRDP